MHSFDLNLDWVNEEEEEEERRLSAEALGSSDEELNGFIDYFLHGSDSDVSQSNQSHLLPEESISRSNKGNEGMDLDFVELGLGLGLGLGLDSDTNNEASFDLNVSVSDLEMFELLSEEAVEDVENESSEVELVCEEDFRLLVNESNTNNEALWSEWDTWDDTYISWSMQTLTCDVDNLPSVTLTQEDLNKKNSICAICMESFCIEEKLKRLPCFHYYHVDCISPWLRTRNTCPTCRYELPII